MKQYGHTKNEDTTADRAWNDLWHSYGAYALGKNYAMLEKLGGVPWVLNMSEGKIKFDGYDDINVQILGNHLPASRLWVWPWAESSEYVPEEFTRASMSMKELGVTHGISHLAEPRIKASSTTANDIALLASGFIPSSGYFAADFGVKRKYLLLDEKFIPYIKDTPASMARVFRDFTKMGLDDHQRAFCSYVGMCGYKFAEKDDTVTAVKNNDILMARFDRGKLKHIQA